MSIQIFWNRQSDRKVQISNLYITKANYNITWWILIWGYLDNFHQTKKTFSVHPKIWSLRSENISCVCQKRPMKTGKQSRIWSCFGRTSVLQRKKNKLIWSYLQNVCVFLCQGTSRLFIFQSLVLQSSQCTWLSLDEQELQPGKGYCFNHLNVL